MASPPAHYSASPTALSPTYPSHAQLPNLNVGTGSGKKRANDGPGGPSVKRRKASTMSVTSATHPLRQTSFPPDDAPTPYSDARSPSVDMDAMSFVSGSQVSGVTSAIASTAPQKKKRGRKSKAEKAREQTPSMVGGRAPTLAGSDGGRRSAVNGVPGGADDAADDDDDPEVAVTKDERTKEEKEEEHRAKGMLVGAFNSAQADRYEFYRAGSVAKAGVRRLINATISQSVNENIVIAMRAVSKVFIGDIIESARLVQGEWIEKTGEKQSDLPTPPASAAASPAENGGEETIPPAPKLPTRDDPRGPLRPDHLREALRRYKVGFEGGSVGMQGLWHQQQMSGVERFPTKTGGRRIFR